MKFLTVEPAMFLQMAGDTLTYVIYQNLFIEKICLTELNYSKDICKAYSLIEDLDKNDTIQQHMIPVVNEIQKASSNFVLYNSLVENSFPVLLVLFLGVWSDATRRRKPPLMLSLIGKLCRSFGLLLNAWFISWPTAYLLLMAALPHSITGSNAVFHMAAFSYISDTSPPRSRTWRLGCAEAFWQLGSPIGLTLGAYLYKSGGYLYVFGTAVIFHLVAVLYAAILLPEVPKPKPLQYTIGKHGCYGTWDNSFEGTTSKRNRYFSENDGKPHLKTVPPSSNIDFKEGNSLLVPGFVVPSRQLSRIEDEDESNPTEDKVSVKEFVVGAVNSILKPRPHHTRKCLLALGFIMLLLGLVFHGELSMKYLFTRNKFKWREQEFSAWVIFEAIMLMVGIGIVMPIVSKLFKFSDPCAGAFASFCRLCSRAIYALAPTPQVLYIGSIVEIPGIMTALYARSLASKCVLRDERGRIFAFLGCIDAVVPLIAVPLYSLVYSSTLNYAPSAIYYMSCGIYVFIFCTYSVLFVAMKMKVVEFSGTDTSSLTDPIESTQILPGTGGVPYCYRRTSLC